MLGSHENRVLFNLKPNDHMLSWGWLLITTVSIGNSFLHIGQLLYPFSIQRERQIKWNLWLQGNFLANLRVSVHIIHSSVSSSISVIGNLYFLH